MPLCQNGLPASPLRENIHTLTVPGTSVQLPVHTGPTGDLLIWFAARWHREVEPLHLGWNWGWSYRAVRGASDLSNHSGGYAIDLNAPAHGLGTSPSSSFSPAQIAAIHRILADAQGALRWGGDYGDPAHGGVRGSRNDPMHTEVIKSVAECARVLAIVTKTPQEDALSAQFEADARARWPREDQLNKDLRADLHVKQLQIDGLVAAVADLEAKVSALATQA